MSLLDMFIERTPDEDKKKETSKKPSSLSSSPNSLSGLAPNNTFIPASGAATYQPAPAYSPQPGINSQDMANFQQHFDELFDKSNLPGPDYYEFQKMVNAMTSLTDEMKIPAVFQGLAVQGLTKDVLITTAQHYIDIIDDDAKNFNSTVDTKIIAGIEQLKKQVEDKKTKLLEKQQMIAQLQQELVTDNQSIVDMNADILQKEGTANSKLNTFKIAADARKQTIQLDIQKINTYIK